MEGARSGLFFRDVLILPARVFDARCTCFRTLGCGDTAFVVGSSCHASRASFGAALSSAGTDRADGVGFTVALKSIGLGRQINRTGARAIGWSVPLRSSAVIVIRPTKSDGGVTNVFRKLSLAPD